MTEDNSRVFLQFKNIIQSVQADNGGVKEPDLTEPRLLLDNMEAITNKRILQKDKFRDHIKGGWHIQSLVSGRVSI